MKTKSFQKFIEKKLSKEKLREIEEQARLEALALRAIQRSIVETMNDYIEENNIGFNELARRLDWSPSKVAKTRKGEANLTIASLAHLCALTGKGPQEIFKSRK